MNSTAQYRNCYVETLERGLPVKPEAKLPLGFKGSERWIFSFLKF